MEHFCREKLCAWEEILLATLDPQARLPVDRDRVQVVGAQRQLDPRQAASCLARVPVGAIPVGPHLSATPVDP